MSRVNAERGLKATADLWVDVADRKRRITAKRQAHERTPPRRRKRRRRVVLDQRRGGSRRRHKIRRMAREKPRALVESTLMMMARRQGHGYQQSEIEDALQARKLAMNYTSPCWCRWGSRTPLRDKRELFALALPLRSTTGRVSQAGDTLAQRFRAIEASITEGGWTVAGHLEVLPAKINKPDEDHPCGNDSRREKRTGALADDLAEVLEEGSKGKGKRQDWEKEEVAGSSAFPVRGSLD